MSNLPPVTPPEKRAKERLDSWKEIATYLNRDVTTVQRWEKREGMPVHRHVHDKRGSVYALGPELDVWMHGRRQRLGESEKEPAANDSGKAQPPEPVARTLSLNSRRSMAVAGIVLVIFVAAAYLMTRSRSAGAMQPKIKSLAVLPLKNLSGDPQKEYLADGMTEALIGRLSRIRDLRVISHTSVMRFKNSELSVPEIAKTLGVDAVVEGSVIPEGDRIRVTAQLIRGATDGHFWSESYDRRLQDALTLQSELAQSIAERVEVTVTGEEQKRLTATRSIAPEVYESYLKGRYAFNKANSREEIEESIGYFEEATRKDPTFAPAYVGIADSFWLMGTVFIGVPPEQTRPKMLSAARKALELEPDLSEAHVLVAVVGQQQWRWSEAEAEFKRALDSNPNNAGAHLGLANWLICQGRTEEALAQAKLARELDPLTISWPEETEKRKANYAVSWRYSQTKPWRCGTWDSC